MNFYIFAKKEFYFLRQPKEFKKKDKTLE